MGLLEALLGKDNGIAQWAGQNNNLLTALGAGLGSGQNLSQGLSNGLQMVPQAKMLDMQAAKAMEEKTKQAQQQEAFKGWLAKTRPDLVPLMDAGVDSSTLFNKALEKPAAPPTTDDITEFNFARQNGFAGSFPEWMASGKGAGSALPNSAQEYEYAKANGFTGTFVDWMQTGRNGSAGPQLGLQPQWGYDPATGKYVMGQMSTNGKFQPTDMGGLQPVDPFAMAGGKQGVIVDAKTAGAARAALRGAEVATSNTQKAIAELRNNTKGMGEWFGQVGPRGIYINPGSEMGKFYAAAEPTNNQAFMQAREALKGGGQITDYEGRKAEDAFSRMRASLEKGDQEQYLRAVADFEEAVAMGFQKLQEAAQGGYATGGASMPGRGGSQTSTGITYTVEP